MWDINERKTEGSIGYDLCSIEEVTINPKEYKLVRTGLVFQTFMPYGLFIFPRSSLFIKKGLMLANSVGVIDFDYCGEKDEVKLLLYNCTDNAVKIEKGERLAQAVFLKVDFPVLKLIDKCENKCNRNGFGSTGGF